VSTKPLRSKFPDYLARKLHCDAAERGITAKELMMGNLQGFAARHHQSCIEISMPEKSQKLRDQSWQTSSILRSHPNRLWSLSRLKQIWLIGHHTSCVGQLPPSDSRAGYHLFCVTSRKMVAINITHPARMLPSNITYSA
jgi:hypothetical protein